MINYADDGSPQFFQKGLGFKIYVGQQKNKNKNLLQNNENIKLHNSPKKWSKIIYTFVRVFIICDIYMCFEGI